MVDEIRQIPARVGDLLADGDAGVAAAAEAIARASPSWASIAGRGTSDHAATFGRYLFETLLGMPTGLAAPSVTSVYQASLDWRGGLLVAVSQSGQSPDVIAVVEAARGGGALTIAVTNDVRSELAAAAECVIDCRAGPERSVAATKTYVAELVVIAMLVDRLRPGIGLRPALLRLPTALRKVIEEAEAWLATTRIVTEFASADRALIVSRGYNLATALEVALKLKETTGLFADGFSTADLEHGPVTLAAADVPVLAIRPSGAMGARVDDVLSRLMAAGVEPWSVGAVARVRSRHAAHVPRDHALALDLDLPDPISPAAFVVPGQLLAEAVARRRGLDPDAPRGLAKITRTM